MVEVVSVEEEVVEEVVALEDEVAIKVDAVEGGDCEVVVTERSVVRVVMYIETASSIAFENAVTASSVDFFAQLTLLRSEAISIVLHVNFAVVTVCRI